MRLTTMTDYSLRLLMYVAQRPERLCTIAEVARAYDISEAHLMKVTHQLGLGGWVETVRGKGGGMRLAALPAEINLGAVVRSIEPDFFLVDCLGSDAVCVPLDPSQPTLNRCLELCNTGADCAQSSYECVPLGDATTVVNGRSGLCLPPVPAAPAPPAP